MAPKINCNPVKLANVVAYFRKSRVAHNIKDLEKALPSVASINGMQVKDYLQHLSDDNQINVEKIGSGNWYWSFASEAKKVRERALAESQSTYDKATAVVNDLKSKLAEVHAQNADEAEMLDHGGDSREDLTATKSALEKEVKALQKRFDAYSDSDPTELVRKKDETKRLQAEFELLTDEVYAMEGHCKSLFDGIKETIRLNIYELHDEWDAEEGMLREVV